MLNTRGKRNKIKSTTGDGWQQQVCFALLSFISIRSSKMICRVFAAVQLKYTNSKLTTGSPNPKRM